jgi:protoheme IX farnesyltransferase
MSLSLAYPRVTTVGDFLALLKPRVMSLVVFTGLAGIVAAPGHVHPLTGFTALLCIAVAAGASSWPLAGRWQLRRFPPWACS